MTDSCAMSAIVYVGSARAKVDDFNAQSSYCPSYWEKTNDGVLSDLKKTIKDYYLKVQDYTCAYCRQKMEVTHNGAWDAEHIIPKASHPKFMFEPRNLCISCKDCNSTKTNKNVLKNKDRKNFPSESSDYIICHPHFDNYDDHVRVLSIAGFYLPRTDKGRTLVEVCGLLRFLYKFTSFESVTIDLKVKMGKLHSLLMETTDSLEESFLLSCIEDLARKGREVSRECAVKALIG